MADSNCFAWYYCNACDTRVCHRRRDALEMVGILRDGEINDIICPFSMRMTEFIKNAPEDLTKLMEESE